MLLGANAQLTIERCQQLARENYPLIKQYGLNSSANVRRLKDALCKKEIVTFDEDETPIVLDPLFEYWVRKEYFNMPVA